MAFQHPELLWLLILLPIYWMGRFFLKQKAVLLPALEDMKKVSGKKGRMFSAVRIALVSIILILFILLLARPQSPLPEKKIPKKGIDILIATDISESMLAEDLKPNRLEAAKEYLQKFIKKLEADRVGLIVFAGQPFTQSPMTFDYNALLYYLQEITTKTINQRYRGMGGTAVGDAILSATNRLKDTEDRTKILILITDGDANVGVDPLFAAENARSKGIKIYTIGIGSKEGAPIPVGKRNGKTVYATDASGKPVMTTFNEESLKQIAQISGGEYFRAVDNDSLQKSLDEIGSLEKTEIETDAIESFKENYWPYAFALFLSLMALAFFDFRYPVKK